MSLTDTDSHGSEIKVGPGDVTLTGGGQIVMVAAHGPNAITGSDNLIAATLHNVDNVISGSGMIGTGVYPDLNSKLIFDNQAGGTVVANNALSDLTINTGHAITNDGTLYANGGRLNVADAVSGSGHAFIIGGGTIDFAANFQENAFFEGGFGAGRMNVALAYAGTVSGFAVNDKIDLGFLTFSSSLTEQWQSDGAGGGTLTVKNSVGTSLATLHLAGNYVTSDFGLANDGAGHTLVSMIENADTVRTALASFSLGNERNLVFTDNASHTGNGNASDNVMMGGAGDDTFFGNGGSDSLNGGDGNDTLVGNDNPFASVADTLNGGNGNDTIMGEPTDTVNGGAGNDVLFAVNSNAWHINLGASSVEDRDNQGVKLGVSLAPTNIETMLAGFGADHIDASTQTAPVTVYGSGGDDWITGSPFADFLWGGAGDDTLIGGAGNDLLFGDVGKDNLSGGAGDDTIYADGSDTINGGDGHDLPY